MKRIRSHIAGIDQGELMLFSDFQDDGEMWTGTGPRERRGAVVFSEPFRAAPAVQVAVSLWDVGTHTAALRADLSVQDITVQGCEIVFRTWGDTRLARLRVAWTAIGELPDDDVWELS
jgi:H-type lectin domain-containing protein